MTSKTHYAMFAFVAVTALSLGLAPVMQEAFAWTNTAYSYTSTTVPSQGYTNTGIDTDYICGANTTATTHVKNNDPTDKIEVWYNFSHCSGIEEIIFSVNINAGPIEHTFTETSNWSGAQIFPDTFTSGDIGDRVITTVTYHW